MFLGLQRSSSHRKTAPVPLLNKKVFRVRQLRMCCGEEVGFYTPEVEMLLMSSKGNAVAEERNLRAKIINCSSLSTVMSM